MAGIDAMGLLTSGDGEFSQKASGVRGSIASEGRRSFIEYKK